MQNRFVEIPALHQSGLYPRHGVMRKDEKRQDKRCKLKAKEKAKLQNASKDI